MGRVDTAGFSPLPTEVPAGRETALDFRPVDPARSTAFLFGKGCEEQGRLGRSDRADQSHIGIACLTSDNPCNSPLSTINPESSANLGRRDARHIRLHRANRNAGGRGFRAGSIERDMDEIKRGDVPTVLREID